MRGDGRIFQRGSRFWIEYWNRGQQFRESGGATEKEARKTLKARLKQIAGDRFVGPKEERLTVDELLDNAQTHLTTKGAKAVDTFVSHLKPVREFFFSLRRATEVKTDDIEGYIQGRLDAKKARATVNREVGGLRQAFYLARKQGRLTHLPYFPMLKEDNARQGFFEKGEFEAVVANLSEPVNDIARFAYLSGWRKGEILPLRWDAVEWESLKNGERRPAEARLRTSKNGKPRTLPLEGVLADVILRRGQAREFTRENGATALSEVVFHAGDGRAIVDFKRSWATACTKAGVPGKLFHDLRRTAVRNMIRAGVPQSVAMRISGHSTTSIFLRYDITSEDDKREALAKTQAHVSAQPARPGKLVAGGFGKAAE